MTHWKLILSYDGTPFHGWQIQPGLPTVQGLLSDAIYRTVGERVLPQGSGRTDTGVHALAQVATFSLAAPIPAANLQSALNRCLPPSIRILSVEAVSSDFHARHSATRKTYEYRIFPLRASSLEPRAPGLEPCHDLICPPILAPYVWPCPWPLSRDRLNRAAAHVVGTHDFTTFAATDPDQSTRTNEAPLNPEPGGPSFPVLSESAVPGERSVLVGVQRVGYSRPARTALLDPPTDPTNTRTLHHSHWHARDALLIYTVTGSGFLHHMVRNLVGTFVQAGSHRLSPDAIPALLAARNRAAAGPTAPATGLFLVSVEYPAAALSTNNQQPATSNPL